MKTNPELQAEELPKGKTIRELRTEIKKLERELRKLRRMIADADQPEKKMEYIEEAERKWERLRRYKDHVDVVECLEAGRPLPSCGGIQPPFLLTMDKER